MSDRKSLHRHTGSRSVPICFRSAAEFCAWNFPKAHKLKTCGCFPKPSQKVLVIRSRHPR